jgi:hypothetical protein
VLPPRHVLGMSPHTPPLDPLSSEFQCLIPHINCSLGSLLAIRSLARPCHVSTWKSWVFPQPLVISPPWMVRFGGESIRWDLVQSKPTADSPLHLSRARPILIRAFVGGELTWPCPSRSVAAPSPACGQATSALLRLNYHRSVNLGERLALTRHLYHPGSTSGHRFSRAAARLCPLLRLSLSSAPFSFQLSLGFLTWSVGAC